MMCRLLKIAAFSLVLSATAQAQDRGRYDKIAAEANRYFAEEQYSLAIQLYSDALTFNIAEPALDYKLAESYRHTFNYAEAEVYYLKVFYTGQSMFPLSLYYYALMLKLNGNLSEAMERFDQFITFHERNATLKDYVEQAIVEKAGCEIARHELGLATGVKVSLVSGDINTHYNDFAPSFRNTDTLVITSSRVSSNRTLIDERYGEAFTDNYLFIRGEKGWEDKTRQQFFATNSLYNDGSGTFTKSGDQYFFTLCGERCRIYETHLANNKWTRPAVLNELINHPESESKHPSISPGGDTLYFSTNRPGGYGQFDIWMSTDTGDNEWSLPVNVGSGINTKANELAPSISNVKNVLFFSSDGHPGYGGYDLFVAKVSPASDTVLYNLNFPFNSVKDDCFLTFNEEGKEIYWSTNRSGGVGGFDIYGAANISALALVSKLSLKNRNDSRMVTLTSRTAKSENVHLLASRNEETIDYNNLTYERKAAVNRMVENRLHHRENRREDFAELSNEEFDQLNEISHTRFQTLLLKQKYASTLLTEVVRTNYDSDASSITGEVIDSHSGTALKSAKILLTNEFGDILKIASTNEEGQFRFTDVPRNTRLFLRLEKASGATVNAFARNIQMMGSENQKSLYVENVYFDFDHYVIRPEAARVLSDLADYLKSNPGAQVEIYAFADDRGSTDYNFELTQKRGEAVVAFLTKHGVDETSFAIIPKGKQSIKFAASEMQRQYNRRAEFYINGVRETFTPSVKTYILKKEADWNLISRLTGIPKEELKKLNNSNTEVVRSFQPIRLPLNAKSISEELFFVGI
jgi:outer membrane protein OmpA-like peptidoglycan-associated protein